jgi:hypothetical protein
MSQKSDQSLRDASLQDIPLEAIEEGLSDVLARSTSAYDAEYGTRTDDYALVIHLFPPGYALDSSKDWPNWTRFRDLLEQAIMERFTIGTYEAGYVDELRSFFVIVKPRPQVPDLTALLERFFVTLEGV